MIDNVARPRAITKNLSRNDTGETGGHQAGILVPKDPQILTFFPSLDSSMKNPRVWLHFNDPQGRLWKFSFIYYNNSYFGGTRNEYRLTWMTAFIKNYNLKAGDKLTFLRDDDGYNINYEREGMSQSDVLRLGTSWKIVRI